ncbi:MAG: hypothetical protein KAF27_10395, partial [Porphyrobacter sp.]|nr:hypothetical protein [Porphyrobacter sp.]
MSLAFTSPLRCRAVLLAGSILAAACAVSAAAEEVTDQDAINFGARPDGTDISLSPPGDKIAY